MREICIILHMIRWRQGSVRSYSLLKSVFLLKVVYSQTDIVFGGRAPWSSVLKNLNFVELHIFYISKNSEKNTHIHESITHMCVNFQGKIS